MRLVGSEFPLIQMFFALVGVLLLIGVVAFLVRRFGVGGIAAVTQRNRQMRLAVVDSAEIDSRRKLMIVRRDNVEHLLLVGGPNDVLVEANILRGAAAQPARDLAAPRTEPAPAMALDNGWPIAPSAEPVTRLEPIAREQLARPEPVSRPEPAVPHLQPAPKPEPPVRVEAPVLRPVPPAPPPPMMPTFAPPAPAFTPPPPPLFTPTIVAAAAPVAPEPPMPIAVATAATEPEHVAGVEAALQLATETTAPAPPVAAAPAPFDLGPESPPDGPSPEEQNLAEMAHRLEAALRRPGTATTAARPAPQVAPQVAPHVAPPVAVPPAAAPRPRPAPSATVPPPPAAAPRQPATSYESLQREMANLLGRQSGSS